MSLDDEQKKMVFGIALGIILAIVAIYIAQSSITTNYTNAFYAIPVGIGSVISFVYAVKNR